MARLKMDWRLVTISVNPAAWDQLGKLACEEGLNTSAKIRRMVLAELKRAQADVLPAKKRK